MENDTPSASSSSIDWLGGAGGLRFDHGMDVARDAVDRRRDAPRQRDAGDEAQHQPAGDDADQPRHGGRGGAVTRRGNGRDGVDGGRTDALHEQVAVTLAACLKGAGARREMRWRS